MTSILDHTVLDHEEGVHPSSAAWISAYECLPDHEARPVSDSTCSLIRTPQFEAVPTPFDAATEVDLFFPLT